jgi:hypothetical protein
LLIRRSLNEDQAEASDVVPVDREVADVAPEPDTMIVTRKTTTSFTFC